MEFTVVTASNLPPKPILAVHAGSVRRQMKLEVNHPFVLPNPGEKASVEVSVFQQLASQLLPEDGKVETKCTIPVRRPDGTATQVRLEIRRDGSHEEKDGQCIQTYLEEHKVQQRIQSLIQEVLREAPEDPYKFMLQQLREIQASTPRHVRSEEPLQPHPPDQPKPAGGRPPAPGRVLTQKQVDKSAWKASKHVVRSVLESPRCRYLGEESIQLGVCQKAARGMTKCIMESACQTVVSEASGRKEVRAVAQQVVKATVASASHMVYLQKSGILSKCTIRSVLIGAIQRLGSSDATLDCLDQPLQPQDLVALATRSSSWAEWLVGEDKQLAPVHMRKLSNASSA
mmetsp:Transcript_42513/g.92384  ORF Transcript_42513/g.92384 Transcript_42513/m.92384 type:complete len:343 (+) Transcript_42513:62-1090(+)